MLCRTCESLGGSILFSTTAKLCIMSHFNEFYHTYSTVGVISFVIDGSFFIFYSSIVAHIFKCQYRTCDAFLLSQALSGQ